MANWIDELAAAVADMTAEPWEAEHRPGTQEECGAVITDAAGNELMDTFNRGYKVSLIERGDGGKFLDVAGHKDLSGVAVLRNNATRIVEALREAEKLNAAIGATRLTEDQSRALDWLRTCHTHQWACSLSLEYMASILTLCEVALLGMEKRDAAA